MSRYVVSILVASLFLAGCGETETPESNTPEIVLQDFDGLSQDCFDASVRVRSRNSIGSASAIKYLVKENGSYRQVESILDATHVEFETNRHVAGDKGTQHVLDIWYEGSLVASVNCKTNESWFQSGVSKDIATIIVSLETLGGAMPIVADAPYGSSMLTQGDKVFMVGCSDGRHPRARCGSVLKVENGLIYYLPQSIGGDSGSAVFAYSKEREEWNVVGRTAWAIKVDGRWVGLAMTSDRVADIRSGRVSAGEFTLPDGALPIQIARNLLPEGAVALDEIQNVAIKVQDELPKPLEVNRLRDKWQFPIRQEDLRKPKPARDRQRNWSLLGGIADFVRSLIRFAFATAVVLLLVGLYIAPTILTPLKYNWPIVAVKQLLALIGRTNAK